MLDILASVCERRELDVFAHCLMGNHVHFFIRTCRPNLSASMQELFGHYAGWFNRRHRQGGHLFQGRFKAQLVERDEYGDVLTRYIHLNPVRARIVDRPDGYPWSSYQAYCRPRKRPIWLAAAEILSGFAATSSTAIRRYRRFVESVRPDEDRKIVTGAAAGLLIGTEKFIDCWREWVERRPPRAEQPRIRSLARGVDLGRNRGRDGPDHDGAAREAANAAGRDTGRGNGRHLPRLYSGSTGPAGPPSSVNLAARTSTTSPRPGGIAGSKSCPPLRTGPPCHAR